MTDRTVKVRLEADISDFVTDMGVKAPAAVKRLEASADSANKKLATVGKDSGLEKLGVKAEAAGVKLDKAGGKGEAAAKKIGAGAAAASKDVDKLRGSVTGVDADLGKLGAKVGEVDKQVGGLGDSIAKADKAAADSSKTTKVLTKDADAYAGAVGRLRVAQLKLSEAQKANKGGSSLAGPEESVASAERAVKKFEKAGDDAGRGFGKRFGSGLKKWFTGDGTSVFKQAGQNAGNGFFGALAGVLKTPVIGPIFAAALIAAVTAVAVPAGAVLAGGVVTGFGAGIGALGLVFAAKSEVIKSIWSKTAADLGAQTRQISKPFETTLASMSVVARRTFAGLKPELAAAFKELAPALTAFGDQLGRAFEKLGPALQPLAGAFSKILGSLGPAMNDLFAQLSSSLTKLSESISKNPTALADFVRGIGGLTGDLLNFLTIMNNADAAFKRFTGGTSAVTALMYTLRFAVAGVTGPIAGLAQGFSAAGDGMNWLAGKLGIGTQAMDQAGASTGTFSSSLFKVTGALTASAAAGLHNAHATHEANVAATLLAGAYDRQAAATQKAIDALNRESNLLLSLSGSQIGYAQAVADATQAIKDNGRTHDLNTQKGRDNQRQLDQVAASAIAQRDAMIKAGDGNLSAAKSALSSRAAYEKLAHQMGYSIPVAKAMAAQLIAIPAVKRVDVQANITDLQSKLATAETALKSPHLTATKKAKLEATVTNLKAGIATGKALLATLPQSRTAKLLAEKSDLDAKIAAAQKELANKNLTKERRAVLTANIANATANIAKVNGMLGNLPPSKTITITTKLVTVKSSITSGSGVGGGRSVVGKGQADGGYYPKGVPSYADGKLPSQATIAPGKGGGMVQWAEQETGGEAFIPLAPSKRDRSEAILGTVADKFGMSLVKSFANGGINLANGQLVDVAYLLQQLGLPFDPTAGANYKSTLSAANRANRAVVPARNTALAADRTEQAAKAQQAAIQRAITLQQRAVTAARAPKQTTKAGQAAEDKRVAAEQKKLIALQDSLYKAKIRTTAATKASNAADAVYKIRAEAAAKAAQTNRDALEKLVAQQQAAVDLAKQVSQGLTGSANIGDLFAKSLTGKGLLADLQSEGADLKKFGQLIAQLRAKKLDEDLISQIIGKGAGQGSDIATAILAGGLSMVNALNTAQTNLENQANLIGAGVANAQYNTKVAGARAGGGGVSAGMTYRVNEKGQEFFTAPINGDVVPAGVDPRRYITSVAGFGGVSSSMTREVHHHQSNYFTGVSMAEADLIAQRASAKAELMNRGY